MKPIPETTYSMSTLMGCLNNAIEKGYTENFHIVGNCLSGETKGLYYYPQDINVRNFYRFEGQSDPDDNSILYLIETPDGRKGTLIDAYGVYADSALSKFMRQVHEITKKQRSQKWWHSIYNSTISFFETQEVSMNSSKQ